MVIDPNNISNATSIGAKSKPAAGDSASLSTSKTNETADQATSNVGDSVSLSPQAQTLSKLQAAVASAPDVDQSKVETLKLAVQSGQYQINADVIAEKLLNQENLV